MERDLAASLDPLAWAALADLCEERGDLPAADRWRRRAARRAGLNFIALSGR